jgi:Ca-activated chloride channel family protein
MNAQPSPRIPRSTLGMTGSAPVGAIVLVLLLAFPLAGLWHQLTPDTSSHAAAARGAKAYQKKDYGAAVDAFGRANALAPTALSAFDLGTAQIAAGKREEGSSTLTKALADPQLRADALYNRGNSALAANAYDYAIRDYVETLKLRPRDVSAKRNLEIAIARKQAAEQSRPGKQQKENAGGKQGPKQPTPGNGKQNEQQPKSDPNVEAMLRAVQQQEQEELSRMNHRRPEKLRVGW